MQQRTLGQQGLHVSAIGYGSMGINLAYGPSDEQQGIAAIQRAHDLGVTFFDTAELYGWGENEKVLGRAVKGFRSEVMIASKFGFMPDHSLNSRPEHIRRVVDNSLRNLGVDRIDLCYQHRVDPGVAIEEVAGAVKDLVDAGKVTYFGLCEAGPRTIRRAHAVQPVSVLQTEYSLFAREVEELFPVLDELGVGLVSYSPLARGFLTGTAKPAEAYDPTDSRRNGDVFPWWQPGNYEHNQTMVEILAGIALDKGVSLPQLALAWLLGQGEHIVPIPGSRSSRRVEENVAAADLMLTRGERQAVAEAVAAGPSGLRNTEGVQWE